METVRHNVAELRAGVGLLPGLSDTEEFFVGKHWS